MISELIGKTISRITSDDERKEYLVFHCYDGTIFVMDHAQDCCENVYIVDITGDLLDLIDSEILTASEDTNDTMDQDGNKPEYDGDLNLWTFYNIATIKGHVTIRWFGASNGYYGVSVDFEKRERYWIESKYNVL